MPLNHRFAGLVKEVFPEQGLALIESKNKIRCGDSIEWISPDATTSTVVESILSENRETLPEISGGLKCYLPAPGGTTKFSMLRISM